MTLEAFVLTPPALLDPSLAIAASRAGGTGLLDLELATDRHAVARALEALIRLGRGDVGVRIADVSPLSHDVLSTLPDGISTIVVPAAALDALARPLRACSARGVRVIAEVVDGDGARSAEAWGANGLIAKGLESGGWIGDETAFILLQRLAAERRLPIWVQGGIGLHSAAGCLAGGAAGVVLDLELALAREAGLPEAARAAIARMDGGETVVLGEELGAPFRAYGGPTVSAVDELRRLSIALADDPRPESERLAEWRAAVRARVGWAEGQLWPMGQSAAFAARLARRFVTVGGVLAGLREAARAHLAAGRALLPLAEDAPLARSHGTRYPILQGPMTRVSDTAAFAESVARDGGLPFLALALLRGADVRALLEDTARRLGNRPWGVGILGFVPFELRQEQIAVVRDVRPPFALIAGGRPDQALALEEAGIATYLHVPSPALLGMYVEQGARRFVFEGRECGGHVGPRSSFALWNAMIDGLLDAVPAGPIAEACHVVFAGGIHDARSAAVVSAMAAPLAERGIKVGALLGTAYLFTEEAVAGGAITRTFQEEALACARTALLETGPGHATRCVRTAFVAAFDRERRRLRAEGKTPEEIRDALEDLNLGRLRIAAKGVARNPSVEPGAPRLVALPEAEQRAEGLFMIGQVASLRDRVGTIAELHRDVADGARRLETLAAHEAAPSLAAQPCDVAIVGMACMMPKAPDLEQFWANVLGKVDAITEIPADRFDWRRYYDPDPQARDKIYSKWGGFLDPVRFDPARYGMPPSSLHSIEPLQLLTLEAVRRALDDAGYAEREFGRKRTGVIVGVGGGIAELGGRYLIRSGLPIYAPEARAAAEAMLPEWTEDSFAGVILNVAAGRVANRLDLGGVNYTVDAACASSLAALYAAVRELESGAADTMIVAGADTVQNPFGYLCFSKTRALSPRGRCRTFDESADGIAISEGVAVVVLKRLADAERDGDRIYAVVKSVAGSSDGRDRSMTAPRPEGQMLALERAYATAGISPRSVELVEAHGTGTVAGDQAEIEALTRAFAAESDARQWCAVGSVKSMVGHTKCAAGLAGLIKIAKAVHHRVLPPTMGVEQPNRRARFEESPFYVNAEARPWLKPDGEPRRAGVSSFGFGGTNFHAVIEEYGGALPSAPAAPSVTAWPAELFLFVGPTREEIAAAVDRAAGDAARVPAPPLRRLAASAWERAALARRGAGAPPLTLAVVATAPADLTEKLAQARAKVIAGAARIDDPRGIYFSAAPLAASGKIAFLFPGQGSQYPNMLRDLAMSFPEVRERFERAGHALADRYPQPLDRYVFPAPRFSEEDARRDEEALKATDVAQPSLGAAGLGMARLLAALGVAPDAAAGHSYGEYVALAAAGALDERGLYELSEARGRAIIEGARGELGTMAAVGAGAADVRAALNGTADTWISNLNSPKQTVISGTRAGIEAAVATLQAAGLSARPVAVHCAFHSPLIAAAGERFAAHLGRAQFSAPDIAVFSNVSAQPYAADGGGIAQSLAEHLVQPVRFMDSVEAMYAMGCRIFVESGPRNILTSLALQTLGDRDVLAVATDVPGRSGLAQLLHALAQLAAHGVPVSLDRVFAGRLDRAEAEPAPTPTTWLVTGGQARPMNGPAPRAAAASGEPAIAAATARPAPREAAPAAALVPPPPVPAPVPPRVAAVAVRAPAPEVPATVPASPMPAAVAAVDPAEDVMIEFQRTMARFLDVQRQVMSAYLGGAAERVDAPLGFGQPEVHGVPSVAAVAPEALPAEAPSVSLASPLVPSLAPSVPLAVPAAPAPRQDGEWLRAELIRVVGERTGYPAEMLDLDAGMEADLGIDSIKRVEVLGALKQALPAEAGRALQGALETLTRARTLRAILDAVTPMLDAPADAPAVPVAAVVSGPRQDGEWLRAELIRVVGERTGYPAEMLDLDAGMEADLGIDSIKRVEVLGALKQVLPAEAGRALQGALETLTRARTLRAILDAVTPMLDPDARGGGPAPAPAAPAGSARAIAATPTPDHAPAVAPPAAQRAAAPSQSEREAAAPDRAYSTAPALPRFALSVEDAPARDGRRALPEGPILVTADDGDVAARVSAELGRRGAMAIVVSPGELVAETAPGHYTAALEDAGQVEHLVAEIKRTRGSVAGLVHLAPLSAAPAFASLPVDAWSARLARDVKGLFHLVRAAGPELVHARDGFVLAVTALDGAFGCRAGGFPGYGGILGLVKTLAVEWTDTPVRALDVDPAEAPEAIAGHVLAEIGLSDGAVEVGRSGARRVVPRVVPAPLGEAAGVPPLAAGSVLLVTGGARGITADVAEELAARYRPTLVLVGKSPLPEGDEPPATAALDDPRALRAALVAQLARGGRPPSPAHVEAAYRALVRDREVRRRIAAMRASGATVEYHAVDVRDAAALEALIGELYRAHGRLDGVIHGAGLIEDKLLLDKTPESFTRVFDTKAISAFVLARALRPESLRFFLLFSSVAGRFGNRGQGDYAAANEVVDKLARELDRAWPGRVAALNWGPWAGGGMVSEGVAKQFAERGIHLVEPGAGRLALIAELTAAKGAPEVVLGRGPWGADAPAAAPSAPIVASLAIGKGSAVELVFDLDAARDRYLDDHRLDGRPVLPAAMAAELMAEIGARGWPDWHVAGIQDFRQFKGVVLADGPRRIRLRAKPETHADGEGRALRVDVDLAEIGAATPSYRGTVVLVASRPEAPVVALPGAEGFQPFPMDPAATYREYLFHGPLFQCIEALSGLSPAGILCAVRPSQPSACLAVSYAPRWVLDPVVLDAAPQLAMIWARAMRGTSALPARFRSLRVYGPLDPAARLRCAFQIDPRSTEETIVSHAYFVGADDRLALAVEGLESNCSRALNRLASPDPR